jgi:hypothetical protein
MAIDKSLPFSKCAEYCGAGSGGVGITIDTAMSDTSENAVQNKVIKKYVDDITGDIETALDELHAYAQTLVTGGDSQ